MYMKKMLVLLVLCLASGSLAADRVVLFGELTSTT